jgi:hypothetical protein
MHNVNSLGKDLKIQDLIKISKNLGNNDHIPQAHVSQAVESLSASLLDSEIKHP